MKKIIGKYVNLRQINIEDASFVLSLRCDEKKSKYLHKTENNIEQQKNYITNYLTKNNEWYFIIENKQNEPIGTYRIYDLKKDSFCIGSWLMVDGTKAEETLEADFLVRNFGFDNLSMNKIHFDVRKKNEKVLRFHQITGAKKVGETELDILFECEKKDYLENMKKFGFTKND